jgi:hypothetical protein
LYLSETNPNLSVSKVLHQASNRPETCSGRNVRWRATSPSIDQITVQLYVRA